MHAAKPAAAIEQATAVTKSDTHGRVCEIGFLTSDLSLTATLRSRYRAPAFKKHPNSLLTI